MREIKFRAWHLGHKPSWKYPPSMLYDEKPGDCLLWKNQGQNIETVMQYTGLKDKNGKEIYEGDIVSDFEPDYFQVEYSNGSYWCVGYKNGKPIIDMFEPYILDKENVESQQLEIIGNIHENPELLERK